MTPDELLADHPDAVQEVARWVRGVLLEHGLDERVKPGWHALTYHHDERGYVVGLFPSDRVLLAFEHGDRLPDVHGRLEGAQLKQVRYLHVRGPQDHDVVLDYLELAVPSQDRGPGSAGPP